jgi:hypothetical protein
MTDPTSRSDPDPLRRRIAITALVIGALLTAAAIYNAAQFWWHGQGFEVPFRYVLYSAWLLPAGVLLLLGANGLRSGRPWSWALIIVAVLLIPAVLLFVPHGYVYFLRAVPR